MTANGFHQALRTFARQVPFRPFQLEFVTGEQITVRHPEAVHIRGDMVVHIAPDRQHRFFDSASVCQLLEPRREPISLQ
jgi:hypothetical protein